MFLKIKDFILSEEKFNLSYIIRNITQLITVSLVIVIASKALECFMDENIRIIAGSVKVYLFIFWIIIALQPLFLIAYENKLIKRVSIKCFVSVFFALYYWSIIYGIYILQTLSFDSVK